MSKKQANRYTKVPGYLELYQKRYKPSNNTPTPLEMRRKILLEQQEKKINYTTLRDMSRVCDKTFNSSIQSKNTQQISFDEQKPFIPSQYYNQSLQSLDFKIYTQEKSRDHKNLQQDSSKHIIQLESRIQEQQNFDLDQKQQYFTQQKKQDLILQMDVELKEQQNSTQDRELSNASPQKKQNSFTPYIRAPIMDQYMTFDNLNDRSRINSFIRSISAIQDQSKHYASRVNQTFDGKSQISIVLQQSINSDFNFNQFSLNKSNGFISSGKKKIFS